MTIKHEGLSQHRLSSNPLEAAYAAEWSEKAPYTLGYLLCGQDKSRHDYSERDAVVAATIIQWLGSPIGSFFVSDVLEKHTKSEIEAKKARKG